MARPSTPEAAEFVTGRFTLRPPPLLPRAPPKVVLAVELPELLMVVPPPGLLYETVGGVVPLLPSVLPLAPPICSTWPLGLVRWPFAPHFTGEVVAGDQHARFDQHLLHRLVQHRDQLADLLGLLGGVVEQQGVGAL